MSGQRPFSPVSREPAGQSGPDVVDYSVLLPPLAGEHVEPNVGAGTAAAQRVLAVSPLFLERAPNNPRRSSSESASDPSGLTTSGRVGRVPIDQFDSQSPKSNWRCRTEPNVEEIDSVKTAYALYQWSLSNSRGSFLDFLEGEENCIQFIRHDGKISSHALQPRIGAGTRRGRCSNFHVRARRINRVQRASSDPHRRGLFEL